MHIIISNKCSFINHKIENSLSYYSGQWISGSQRGVPLAKRLEGIRISSWRMDFVYGLVSGWDATNYIDITDEDGSLIGMVYADISLNTLGREVMIFPALYIPVPLLVIAGFAGAASHVLEGWVIIPIDELSERAKKYTACDKTVDEDVEEYFDDPGLDPGNDHHVALKPGDAVFQYTDGVVEAMDAEESLFGESRLLEALNSAPDADPEKLLPFVHGKVDEFVNNAPQYDDLTMLGWSIMEDRGIQPR